MKMKAEMECMQKELDKQLQANSGGVAPGVDRCAPQPCSNQQGTRRAAHSQAGNGMCHRDVLTYNASLVCVGGRGVSWHATALLVDWKAVVSIK